MYDGLDSAGRESKEVLLRRYASRQRLFTWLRSTAFLNWRFETEKSSWGNGGGVVSYIYNTRKGKR